MLGARRRIYRSVAGVFAVTALVVCVAPTNGFAFGSERAYEMVSPVFKGGYGANGIVAVAPDGNSLAFDSLGAFAGDPDNNSASVSNDYVSTRGESSWSTGSLQVPTELLPAASVDDFSSSLGTAKNTNIKD